MSDDDGENVKVYLRFRPMNKLETSKRSKDCIHLHDNPQIVTVDSPLQGVYDFTFDMVFDEYASQQEVYNECLSDVPKKILDGVNCSVLAHGQTGTGKTHTMMGEGQGIEMIVRSSKHTGSDNSFPEEGKDTSIDPKENPRLTEGMMPRTVADIFAEIQKQPKSVQCTVRCSFVEIYVEKFYDLIQPSNEGIMLGEGEDGEFSLIGASELCCLEPQDVYSLLARGNTYRTISATKQNADISRSHTVLSLKVESIDRSTGTRKASRLLMLDLAGSEQGVSKSSRQTDSALAMESRMVNASLQHLLYAIRAKLNDQGKKERLPPHAKNAYLSKLAKLLKSSIGGNCYMTCICMATPSSYGIAETVNTIKYGQKLKSLKNFPKPHNGLMLGDSRAKKREENLTKLIKVLAVDCKALKQTGRSKLSWKLWEEISKIADSGEVDASALAINVYTKGDRSSDSTAFYSRETEVKLKEYKAARDKAESSMRDYQSERVSLRSEKELMTKDKKRIEQELDEAKIEIASLSSQNEELESMLRTSQFRERESVLFLRQFRTFYTRLMKNKASQGSGDAKSIVAVPVLDDKGVPHSIEDIIDIDKLMIQSGLLEEAEMGNDTNQLDYVPSADALLNSKKEADLAEEKEMEKIVSTFGAEDPALKNLSVVKRSESGKLAAYRQKLLGTPAAQLAMKKEKEIENDLIELSTKCMGLQNAVNAEKAMVEALSARQGALSKLKTAQEMNFLRSELERKSYDVRTIVVKMNELHSANKTLNEKNERTDQHLAYFEEHMIDLQTRNRRLLIERQQGEKRLREENNELGEKLEGMKVKMWQFGEAPLNKGSYLRLTVPCSGESIDLGSAPQEERNIDIGKLSDDAIKLLAIEEEEKDEQPAKESVAEASISAASSVDTVERSTQTNKDIEVREKGAVDNISIQTDSLLKPASISPKSKEQSKEQSSEGSATFSKSLQEVEEEKKRGSGFRAPRRASVDNSWQKDVSSGANAEGDGGKIFPKPKTSIVPPAFAAANKNSIPPHFKEVNAKKTKFKRLPPPKVAETPEWMQQFRKIGLKGTDKAVKTFNNEEETDS